MYDLGSMEVIVGNSIVVDVIFQDVEDYSNRANRTYVIILIAILIWR